MLTTTREAIQAMAKELGFSPNQHARWLAHGRARNVIALMSHDDLGVASRLKTFVTFRLDEAGYELETYAAPVHVSCASEKQIRLVTKVRMQRPAAVVLHNVAEFLHEDAKAELLRYQDEGGQLFICGEKVDWPCDQSVRDEGERMAICARHLIELGHRDIGVCFHGRATPQSRLYISFLETLQDHGIKTREEWMFFGGNYEEGGHRLAQQFLALESRPTGICVVNDASASAFINILTRMGMEIPRDVSIVGHDDEPAARYALVPLTTVTFPLESLGWNLVSMVSDRLEGRYDGEPRTAWSESKLVVRESAAAPSIGARVC